MHLSPLGLRLRTSTRTAHHRIDHHPLLAPLVRQELDVKSYGQALAALHGPILELERLVSAGLAAQHSDYGFSNRCPALEADLASLKRLPAPLRVPSVFPAQDQARLVGYLYVLEGSRLGGEVIADQLKLSLPQEVSRQFFSQADSRGQWARFWEFGESCCPPERHDQAAQAALAAFDFILRHLDDCLAQEL